MIPISELTQKDIGRWVQYQDGIHVKEIGRIKDFNEHTIFVVFRCGGDWQNYQRFTGQSCSQRDLVFWDKEKNREYCDEHHYVSSGGKWSSREQRKCVWCGDEIGA